MSRLSGLYLETATPSAWNTLVANTTETADFTVPGAQIGDFVWVSVEATAAELAECIFDAQVSAANTVTVACHPDAGTTGLVAEAVLRIKVVPKDAI
jgi:hypothetical protein